MIEAQPRVTALIVARNNADALRSTLEALERSSGRDRIEVLVVDEGSEDATSDTLGAFPEVISLKIPKRIGWTRAVNIALRTARGEYILFVSPGVLVRPETVHGLADRFEASSDAGAVCPRVDRTWRFPSVEGLAQAWRNGGKLPGGDAADTATDYPQGAPILVRKELLRAMNYLDTRFGDKWSDLEMCSRIRDGNKRIVVASDLPVERVPANDDIDNVDSAHGIATWLGIHYGFAAGFKFRMSAAFALAGRGHLGDAFNVIAGGKIDGNQ
ncbi:MAG TPA: glycosyltransferase [Bryobacteraceae bacterium]|nr:glycosyltransferase [Bryobacteraceae bacterium]